MTDSIIPESAARGAATGRALDPVALAFEHVSMVFPDGTHALQDVSFQVRRGEFVTIVGPSGCGKSTVLRIASGLLRGATGTFQLADDNIGYVFQDATLLPWRTVEKNVELFAELHGVSKDERRRRTQAAIELVGLTGFEGSYPRRLSGGMRMRASLARSLTLDPKLFFFDEPFGALDEITRENLNEELLSLFVHQNFSALFITHSIAEAVYLSSRVLVMSSRPGRLVAEFAVPFPYPRTEDLRYHPAFAELSGQVSQALREAH